MTATERSAISFQVDVIFRLADHDDLPKLEWYGQYTHFRRVFQRAYEDQLAGRRLMLLADVNGQPIGQVFIQLKKLDDPITNSAILPFLYSLPATDPLRAPSIGTGPLREADSILI